MLRLLWAGDADGGRFDGTFYSFTNLCSFPKPLAGCPSTSAAPARAAARRAGLRGDGYFPGGGLTEPNRQPRST